MPLPISNTFDVGDPGAALQNGLHREDPPEIKGYVDIWKGRDFVSYILWKGGEVSHFGP